MGSLLVTVAHFFGATTVSPDGYAYWAQAIATVAAIVVTMGLAFFPGWMVLRREAQDRRNVKFGLVRLAEHAADAIVWPAVILRKCIRDVEQILDNCDAASSTMPRETISLLKTVREKILDMRGQLAA